jgi:hypothetical protein
VNDVVKKGLLSRMAVPLIVLLFIAPMVAAWIVYNYFPDVVRSLGVSNNGEFIIPPAEIKLDGFVDIDNTPLPAEYFKKNWSYVYISETCDADCVELLMLIKNVRLTQGKEISRLRRLLVLATDSVDVKLREQLAQFPGMQTVLLSSEQQRSAFLKAFIFEGNPSPATAGHIYVVDPDAKLMMYYSDQKEILKLGKGMQKDMSKLMHNSQLRK